MGPTQLCPSKIPRYPAIIMSPRFSRFSFLTTTTTTRATQFVFINHRKHASNNPHRPPHLRQIPPSRPATNLPRRAHRLLQPPIPLPPPPHLRRNPVRLPHRLRPRPLLPPRPRPQRKRLRKGRPRLHLRRRQASPIPKRYRHPRWHELHQGVAVSAPL